VPNIDAGTLSDYMIPEGSHKFGVLHTYFTVGRLGAKELNIDLLNLVQNQSVLLSKIFEDGSLNNLYSYWR